MDSNRAVGHFSRFKRPRQESNLVYELRRLACEIRHTPRTKFVFLQHPAEESNPVLQFRRLPCFRHTRRANCGAKKRMKRDFLIPLPLLLGEAR